MSRLDLLAAALLGDLDPRLSYVDRYVLHAVADDAATTLDGLVDGCTWPKEFVFGAVGRLERFGLLPEGMVR